MPFNYDPNLDPDREELNQAPQLAGSSQVIGGGSIPAAAAAPGAPSSSGSFSNLNKYLDANAGSGFGGNFVDKVNTDVNAAGAAQNQAGNMFQAASDAGSVKSDAGNIANTLADPTQAANQSEFQKYLGAQYQGPTTYESHPASYQTAYGATQRASDTAQAAGNESGRFALLNNYFGNANYNQGQKSLDNLLVQADPVTQQGISQAKTNADLAQNNLRKQSSDLSNYAAGNIATTEQTANKAKQLGTEALTGTRAAQEDALAKAQTANAAYLADRENENNLVLAPKYGAQSYAPDANVDNFGLALQGGPNEFDSWGLELRNYLNAPNVAATASSVTTPEQAAKLRALEKMMGEAETPFTESELGTYASGAPFDNKKYQNAIQSQKNAYRGEAAPHLQRLAIPDNPSDVHSSVRKSAAMEALNQLRAKYGLQPFKFQYPTPPGGGAPFGGGIAGQLNPQSAPAPAAPPANPLNDPFATNNPLSPFFNWHDPTGTFGIFGK